jgi:hypothetical protein
VLLSDNAMKKTEPRSAVLARLRDITNVWQIGGEFNRFPVITEPGIETEFRVLGTRGHLVEDSSIVAEVHLLFRLIGSPTPGQEIPSNFLHPNTGKVIVAYVTATFMITYTLDAGESLGDSDVQGFCRVNGVHTAWPFWREFITSSIARAGLHNVPIPPFIVDGVRKPPFLYPSQPGAKDAANDAP